MGRAQFMGEPNIVKIPVAQLLDKKYADKLRESIDRNRATPSETLKRPSFEELDRSAKAAQHPEEQHRESPQTTHSSAIAEPGNVVALTTTLNDTCGSRVTAGASGCLLNAEL